MPEPKYENEFIKYVFTDEKKQEIAADMAQKIVTLQQTEDERKIRSYNNENKTNHA